MIAGHIVVGQAWHGQEYREHGRSRRCALNASIYIIFGVRTDVAIDWRDSTNLTQKQHLKRGFVIKGDYVKNDMFQQGELLGSVKHGWMNGTLSADSRGAAPPENSQCSVCRTILRLNVVRQGVYPAKMPGVAVVTDTVGNRRTLAVSLQCASNKVSALNVSNSLWTFFELPPLGENFVSQQIRTPHYFKVVPDATTLRFGWPDAECKRVSHDRSS